MTLLAVAIGGRGVVDPNEPVLHADDQALLRGRAAFETIRVYAGRPFKLADHIARIAASSARLGLPPVDAGELNDLASAALTRAGERDAALRLYWTAGRESGCRPTALALVSTIPAHLEDLRARGIIAKTGFKYGSHFRAYDGNPRTHHAKYLVHALPSGYRGMWPEVSRAVRLAHGVKKQLLLGAAGDKITYLQLERVRP